jgi:aldehyde dehydrogenase (NAD+)
MPIAGTWRAGGVGSTASDLNPFTGETLVEIPQADAADVDSAYRRARDAQRQWERTPPSEQAQVFLRAAQIMDARREEIFDWLTVEAGSTRVKCEWEWTLKPASGTPVTGALLLAKIYEEAGLPMSLLSVIVGRGREVGDP